MFNGKIHYKWSFPIAMLNYQRVLPTIHPSQTDLCGIYQWWNRLRYFNGDVSDVPVRKL